VLTVAEHEGIEAATPALHRKLIENELRHRHRPIPSTLGQSKSTWRARQRLDGIPTHYECSLFSAMICPFFATPQARHSETGTGRGRFAAVLGFKRVHLYARPDENGDVEAVEFTYDDLQDVIVFERPGELAERLAVAVEQAGPIDFDERLYWRSDAELEPAWEEAQKNMARSWQSR
jgi:hypothetical protein